MCFLIYALKHRSWVLVRTAPLSDARVCTHDLCFKQKYEKYHNFSSENYHFKFTAAVKYHSILHRRVFVMGKIISPRKCSIVQNIRSKESKLNEYREFCTKCRILYGRYRSFRGVVVKGTQH